MIVRAFIETALQFLNWAGIPVVLGWALYDRRKLKNDNEIAEATAGDKVKTSSIVTLEAELVAARKSFDADRSIKDQTIEWLRDSLAEARVEDARKDELIEDLLRKVRTQGRRIEEMAREQVKLESELIALKNGGGGSPLAPTGVDPTGP